MAAELSSTDTCSTPFGRFRVKRDPSNLFVGGTRFCVSIAIQGDSATLSWLSTDVESDGCILAIEHAEGWGCNCPFTIERAEGRQCECLLADLAFSLLRTHYPQCKEVTLLDDSGVSWMGPRSRKYKVNFLKGYVLFYQQTWYEQKFGATMVNDADYERYRRLVSQNFNDPSKKPSTFSFGTYESELMPLYQAASTWKEFTDAILREYGEEKYKMCYDWYRMALYHVLDGIEINQYWKISIASRPFYACEQESMRGGRHSTRKHRRKIYYLMEAFQYPVRSGMD